MKIGIFDPYLDTLGGGEKYVLDIAACLSPNHSVSLFWNDPKILEESKKRFDIDLSNVSTTRNIFSSKTSFFERARETKTYDVIFYMSDGSIPTLFSKKNILIFQFPTLWVNGKSPVTKLKLKRINAVVCYSDYVKKYLDTIFGIKSAVIPPAVEIGSPKAKKENIILTVGRFTRGKNKKKQEVLIDVFRKMCDDGLSGWKLLVAGSVLPSDKEFVESLKDKAKGYLIEVLENLPLTKLVNYYSKAKIYWHAAGFEEDLSIHPENAEHFGITTIEAMANEVVPVVFNGGGQTEIVSNEKNGFLWETKKELMEKTKLLIKDKEKMETLGKQAREKAKEFSREKFCDRVKDLIK